MKLFFNPKDSRAIKKSCVFIGTIEVAGVASNLALGLKQIGYDVLFISKFHHRFAYEARLKPSRINAIWQKIGDWRQSPKCQNKILKILGFLLDKCVAFIVLAYALKKCDIFVLNFGSQIVSRKFDLLLLKYLNKKIIVIYLGSDSRPPYLDGGRFPGVDNEEIPKAEIIYKQIKKCKKMVALHERYADYIINNRHSGHYFKKPFLDYEQVSPVAVIGLEDEATRMNATEIPTKNDGINILHIPSNSLVKGTTVIESTIQDLQKDGYPIHFTKIENVTNAEVQANVSKCDFIIDQLYSDQKLPVFATEAALQAKPVIIAGYSASLEFQENVATSETSFFVHPTQIRQAIIYFLENPKFRECISGNAKIFSSNHQTPHAVALRFELMFADDVPDNWYCHEFSTNDLTGCGLTEERRTALMEAVINKYGSSAL